MKKKFWLFISIGILLVFLNPTKEDFKDYLKMQGNKDECYTVSQSGRTIFLGVISIYKHVCQSSPNYPYLSEVHTYYYIGVFKNFIPAKIHHQKYLNPK